MMQTASRRTIPQNDTKTHKIVLPKMAAMLYQRRDVKKVEKDSLQEKEEEYSN